MLADNLLKGRKLQLKSAKVTLKRETQRTDTSNKR